MPLLLFIKKRISNIYNVIARRTKDLVGRITVNAVFYILTFPCLCICFDNKADYHIIFHFFILAKLSQQFQLCRESADLAKKIPSITPAKSFPSSSIHSSCAIKSAINARCSGEYRSGVRPAKQTPAFQTLL